MITKDLGAVSAYAYAVEKGYTGTEEEYAELMASYASVAEQASQSAQTATEKAQQASASATSASQSADTASASAQTAQTAQQTATAKASEAQQGATTATTKAQEASQSASESSQSASTAVQAKQDAQTAKTASETAQASAESARDDAESARDEAQQYAESIDPQKLIGAYPVDTATGAIASFPDGADNIPMKKVTVRIEPKQAGTGDPSPDNVRPISGWDSVHVNYSGVNVWDEEWEVGDINATTGQNAASDTVVRTKNYIPVLPETEYFAYVSGTSGLVLRARFYDSDKNYLGSNAYGGAPVAYNGVFKTPINCYFMRFTPQTTYGTTYNHDISINYPATDQDYHPYSGQSISIPLPQTVYGGTLDVTTGELVVTHASKTFDGTENWFEYKAYEGYSCGIEEIKRGLRQDGKSNMLVNSKTIATAQKNAMWLGVNSRIFYVIGVYESMGSTLDTFKAFLAGHNLVVTYPLEFPITYQLTPTEIKSLLGDNNIWADAGDSTVTYRADTTMYINRKIAEAVSALS